MSLTLMFKGHFIDSEISTNKNMQRLGIKCAVQESREDSGQTDCVTAGCSGNCSACDIEEQRIHHAPGGEPHGSPPQLPPPRSNRPHVSPAVPAKPRRRGAKSRFRAS